MASPSNNRDKEILNWAVPGFKSGRIDEALILMVLLAKANDGSTFADLGLTPEICTSLVLIDSALENAVRDCFEKESLDPLWDYSVLALSRLSSETDVMKRAWDIEYKGDADKLFVRAVHIMNTDRDRRIYDNVVPIVQSSGTGTSRMTNEAAKYIFTLPFNLRPSLEIPGFPLGDPEVRDFLIDDENSQRLSKVVQLRYLKFFESLFTNVGDKIKRFDIFDSYEALAKHWHDKLSDSAYRSELYHDTVESVREKNPVEPEQVESLLPYETAVRNSLQRLLATIDEHSSNHDSIPWSDSLSPEDRKVRPVRLMLYFDDCDRLFDKFTLAPKTPHPRKEQRSVYQILCEVSNACVAEDLFVVYLSAKLALVDYSPYCLNSEKMQAPIVELPFDTFATVHEDNIKLEQVSEPGYMVQFGRPLFWTRWQAADPSGADGVRRDLFLFAKAKILGWQCSNATKRDGQLAALGIRVLLEFETFLQSAEREARLAEGHMRVVYSVPKHRQYLRGGTPSEPVLAEAAARIMSEVNSLATIADFLKDGLMSKGERREFLARLLLTLAHDECIDFDFAKAHEAQYSQPVLLSDFLEALVGPGHMTKILESRPDNFPDGATFKEAFKDAKVNFTHFVKAGDESAIADEVAWMALSRCMAFQCADGQRMVDLYIPILLWDEPLGRYVVSGIFIQIKDRLKTQSARINVTKLDFFTRSPAGHSDSIRYNERPYITIVMDLGIQPGSPNGLATENEPSSTHPAEASAEISAKSNIQATPPSNSDIDVAPTILQHMHRAKRPIHPRYAITIVGCSNAVYQVIRKEDEDQYAALLTSGAQQGDIFSRGFLRLKPYWTMSAQSFHWATGGDGKAEGGLYEPFVEGVYVGARSGNEEDSDDEDDDVDSTAT